MVFFLCSAAWWGKRGWLLAVAALAASQPAQPDDKQKKALEEARNLLADEDLSTKLGLEIKGLDRERRAIAVSRISHAARG